MQKLWRFLYIWLVLLSFLCLAGAPARAQGFTLEQVLSFPYPTNLVAARNVDRIAWVLNDRGVRNIWTAVAPDFVPVQLTHYDRDDGQELGHLALTPDGSILVYVRGGNPNRAGEYPNPTSDPDGAEQAIWAVRTDGGEPWRIARGSNPVLSPDGTRILYTYRGQIYEAPLQPPEGAEAGETKPRREPKPLFRARGRNGSPTWSPDGRYVAFVSNRGDHSFIGVFDREQRAIRWMAPSVDRDSEPVWSPDGRYIVFFRFPGQKKHERYSLVSGRPFSIMVADVATGEAREIWRSPGSFGGFAQYYPAHPLRWTETHRILFYSEHQDWIHIYSLSPEGGNPVELTPGECEAEHSDVSPDGTFLVFSSNCRDIDRRHLWRVPTAGGRPEPLTKGLGIETDPVVLASGQYIVYRGATALRPQTVTVIPMKGGAPRWISPEPLPGEFPMRQLVVPSTVILKAADGLEVHAQLFLPRDAKPGDGRPAVIFMHGGPIRQMLLGWHYRGYYARAYAFNQYLANKGYVVLSVNFRSGIGYGRSFRQAPRQGPRGASEYQDIRAAGLYLRRRPEVDPDKIGLWGGSYGGYLTALGLARDSDLFAAGVDLHGVHDWAFRATDFSPGGGWGLTREQLELAYRSSPVAYLDFWTSPVLLIHGDDDRNVLFQQSTDLAQRLREKGVHVEVLVLPDEVHGFLRHASWLKAYRAAAEFFDRFLAGRKDLS